MMINRVYLFFQIFMEVVVELVELGYLVEYDIKVILPFTILIEIDFRSWFVSHSVTHKCKFFFVIALGPSLSAILLFTLLIKIDF